MDLILDIKSIFIYIIIMKLRILKNAFEIKQTKPDELGEKEQAILEKLARKINKYGMALPAIIFLESVKPLSFVAGQVMVFFKPFISAFFNTREYDLLASMLEDRNAIEALLKKIEALEQNAPQ